MEMPFTAQIFTGLASRYSLLREVPSVLQAWYKNAARDTIVQGVSQVLAVLRFHS